MKRITLAIMMIAAVGTVGAQERPTPPARPAAPAPAGRPTPAPRAIPMPAEPGFHRYGPDIDDIRFHVNEASRMAIEIDREAIRHSVEAARVESAHAVEMARIDVADGFRVFVDGVPVPATPVIAPMPTITPLPVMPAMAPMPMRSLGEDFRVPRPVFVQGEPADSIYRLAHEVLSRGDYGRAAQMFRDIAAKYPKSIYENDLPYYEAYARYKIGTTNELQNAAKLLEPRASKLIGVVSTSSSGSSYNNFGRRTSEADVAALYIRINSVLASRGNSAAAAIVSKAAQSGANTCDREDMQIKVEAMSALSQMDPSQALPIVRRVLDKKDECTIELRKRAVFILGRRGDSEAASLLASTAKSDPAVEVRMEAIGWLPKVQGDAGVNMLEELLRTEQEERIQRAVVRTLTSSDNQRARSSMRALIDRKEAPINLRVEAINSFNSERATNDDASYLRSLYSRADNDRVKEAVINAIGRIGGVENDQWVLNIAKNPNESSQLRGVAIARLIRGNVSVADLSKLYDASDAYDIRTRIVSQLERRNEAEAADKLYEIVRNSTVINIRTQALNALTRRKDPRSLQLLQEILDGRKP